jgi:hypothetical protein
MTQEEFIAALVCRPGESFREHDDVVAGVGEKLRQLLDEQQFQILFPIAVKSQSHGDFPVLDAAILLHRLSPECPVSCENAMMALLPEWDVSIEQVVFYLAARFGSERVREAICNVERQVTSERDKTTLRTIVYWVGIYDEAFGQKSRFFD